MDPAKWRMTEASTWNASSQEWCDQSQRKHGRRYGYNACISRGRGALNLALFFDVKGMKAVALGPWFVKFYTMELIGTPDTESDRSCRLQSLKSHQSCPIVERITWESLESILLSLGDLEYVVFFIMCAFVLVILEHSLTVMVWWNWLMFTAHLQTWLWKVAHSISWSIISTSS